MFNRYRLLCSVLLGCAPLIAAASGGDPVVCKFKTADFSQDLGFGIEFSTEIQTELGQIWSDYGHVVKDQVYGTIADLDNVVYLNVGKKVVGVYSGYALAYSYEGECVDDECKTRKQIFQLDTFDAKGNYIRIKAPFFKGPDENADEWNDIYRGEAELVFKGATTLARDVTWNANKTDTRKAGNSLFTYGSALTPAAAKFTGKKIAVECAVGSH